MDLSQLYLPMEAVKVMFWSTIIFAVVVFFLEGLKVFYLDWKRLNEDEEEEV